jgi:tetratricopeptide (TPR) repeat protein
MTMGAKSYSVFAALALVLVSEGCGGTRFYRAGREAEKKGDSATAYKEYCRAAERYRSNEIVENGLARVRPAVAAQAERAGLAAMDEGRYDDAWRSFMRALDIQPDHANAAQLIRQVERDHPEQIASAKSDWMSRGSAALSPPPQQELAMASPPPPRPRERATPSATPLRETTLADSSESADAEPEKIETTAEPVRPRQFDRRPVAPAETQVFLSIHTLSLKDRRYARLALAADGVGIKLTDTESDDEVDLDLFNGKKRIQKVRDLELGRSQTFRGKSGTLYRLTLLSVHHKSHTVRLGVKRA